MESQKDEQGFTLIELAVVIAIMGIISTLMIPAFGRMMAKAKLIADVTTIRTLQNQIELYNLEGDRDVLALEVGREVSSRALQQLVDAGYLDRKSLGGNEQAYELDLQSGGIARVYNEASGMMVKLDVSSRSIDESVRKYVSQLSKQDSIVKWIAQGTKELGDGANEKTS